MKQIIKYIRYSITNHPAFFGKTLLFSLLITFFNVCPLYVLQFFLNDIESRNIGSIILWAIMIMALLIANAYMNALFSAVLDEYGGTLIKKLMTDAQEALDHSSMNEIDELDISRIKHILFGDCMDIFRVIGHHIPMLFSSLLFVLFGLILARSYSLKNTLLVMLSFVFGILISVFSRSQIDKVASGTNDAIKQLHSQLNDYADVLEYSKINGYLAYHQKQTEEHVDDFINKAKKEDKTINFWSRIISNYNLLINILFSALLALPTSHSSDSQFAFFMVLLSIVLSQGQEVESLLQYISKSLVSFRNYDSLMNMENRKGDRELNDIETIDIRNISFNYINKEPVLKDYSLTLNKGDCVLLEGLNGSGKSTLLKLVTGLYRPQNGEILINGISIDEYQYCNLIKEIIYLGQDEPILNLSVDDYLKQIRKDVTEQELAKIHELLNLPDGNMMITHNGDNLSGGQKKKMIIAKMLLKENDASVLILDEIEAGLDKETLRRFIGHVCDLAKQKNKIILIITHSNKKDYPFNEIIRLG